MLERANITVAQGGAAHQWLRGGNMKWEFLGMITATSAPAAAERSKTSVTNRTCGGQSGPSLRPSCLVLQTRNLLTRCAGVSGRLVRCSTRFCRHRRLLCGGRRATKRFKQLPASTIKHHGGALIITSISLLYIYTT